MTKDLLEEYPDICAEIEDLERENKTVISDIVRGSSDEFPFTEHPITVRGIGPQRYAEHIAKLKAQKQEIEQFVFGIKSAWLRRVVMLRAFHGYSWDRVAAQMSKSGKAPAINTLKSQYYGLFKNECPGEK